MGLNNKVVVRCRDGRMIKGYTLDFVPGKDSMHVTDPDDPQKVTEIAIPDVKAVFYVKTFQGNPRHASAEDALASLKGVPGLKIKVAFRDGEVLYGTTNGYNPGRKGFFVVPADKTGNNERIYVFAEATEVVETWR